MSDSKRGQAFTLSEISRSQSKKTWFTLNDVFIDSPGTDVPTGWNYGYFHDNGTTNVYRYDISNDTSTTALKAPSPLAANNQTGNNQGEYGYSASGRVYPGGDKTTKTERLDYANDTLAMVEKGDLSYETYWGAGSNSNNDYGYWAGGYHPGTQPWNNTYLTSNSRIDFSSDTTAAVTKGKLTTGRYDFGSTFCNKNYGYWAGGMTGGYPAGWGITRVDRLDYANDTNNMSIKSSLADSRSRGAGSGNKDYGYIMGGNGSTSPYDGRTEITRMDYSNDGVAPAPKGNLYRTLVYCSAVGDADYGYIGGKDKADNVVNSYFQRVDYANDTATALPKGVALGTNPFGSGANGSFSFSGMNYNLASNTFTETKVGGIPVGTNYGYWVGGNSPAGDARTSVDRLDYTNDSTNMVSKGPLAQGRRHASASSNTNYTWVSAGDNGAPNYTKLTYVDRIDYSNDTATALARGNTAEHGYASGTGNQNHGYIFGGQDNSFAQETIISRIDYSNDGVQAVSRGNTNISARLWASGGNLNYAYVAGGVTPAPATTSVTQRLEYAIDDTAMVAKGNLPIEKHSCTAVTNDRYMYVCGGEIPGSPGFSSSTDRITYANDTATALTKANLAVTKKTAGGATNKTSTGDFGYTAGGAIPSGLWSITDRIDFSNDTTTAVTKGTLTVARDKITGSSSRDDGMSYHIANLPKISLGYFNRQTSNSGYINGGTTVPSVQNASYYKYDFDNDTNAVAVRGYSPYTDRTSHTALNTGLASYWCGGFVDNGDATSLVDRFEYANDTGSLTPKGNLAIEIRGAGSSSNDNAVSDGSGYGFIGGGLRLTGPATYTASSHIQRIDYANDTSVCDNLASMLPGGYSGMFTVGTRSHGYWAGGLVSTTPSGSTSSTTIRRLDYSNTTIGALFRSSIDIEQNGVTGDTGFQSGGSLSSHTHGYFVGGGSYDGTPSFSNRNKVMRYDFSNDLTVASPRCTNGSNATGTGKPGMGNESYGYTVGGYDSTIPGRISSINRLDYANDTLAMVTKSTTVNESAGGAAISARDRGYGYVTPLIEDSSPVSVKAQYALSGSTGSPSYTATSDIYQIRQDNSTSSIVPKGNWSENRFQNASYANRSRAYRVSGRNPSSTSRIDRFEFANDTTTDAVAFITSPGTGRRNTGGMSSNNGAYGWIVGGRNFSYYFNSAERIDFSNETNVNMPGVTWDHSFYYESTASGGNQDYGYWAGGIRYPTPSYGTYNSNQRLDFSTNTMISMPTLPTWRMGMAGMSNKNYAYFAGGSYPGYKSTVWRISYASDTETMVEKGPLPQQILYASAASNEDYGYVWYGNTNPTVSAVYRIDFSNDTAQTDFVASLPAARTYGAGASASDHGL